MDKGTINLNLGEHRQKLETMAVEEQRTMTVILQRMIDEAWSRRAVPENNKKGNI
jgi:hypothetical protein